MNNWISVSDKLPDEAGYYLVYWSSRWGTSIDIVYFRGKTHWAKCNNVITHWMPLPNPPMN